ncbi:MAG: hypothetical protein KAX49_06095 [Halanaerobiales bacterium]|nr:hypothetical protein [Halanaerobiales bacterium]
MNDTKISSFQLAMLMMGFMFGTSAFITVVTRAQQDAWIAFLIGWVGGFIIIPLLRY